MNQPLPVFFSEGPHVPLPHGSGIFALIWRNMVLQHSCLHNAQLRQSHVLHLPALMGGEVSIYVLNPKHGADDQP